MSIDTCRAPACSAPPTCTYPSSVKERKRNYGITTYQGKDAAKRNRSLSPPEIRDFACHETTKKTSHLHHRNNSPDHSSGRPELLEEVLLGNGSGHHTAVITKEEARKSGHNSAEQD